MDFCFNRVQKLIVAVRNGERCDVLEMLQMDPFSAVSSDFDGVTALHVACFEGHEDLVKLLLAYGACISAQSVDGSTPLCDACAAGRLEIARLLISRGAAINPQLSSSSPLHEATVRGSFDCCQLLIDHGANLEVSDLHYGTPLLAACHQNRFEIAKLLLNFGANVNARKIHTTPLHLACENENSQMIVLLLNFGANPKARNNHNRKPVDFLCENHECRSLLQFFEENPRSLTELSRFVIRKRCLFRNVMKLPLPENLKVFLKYGN